MSFEFALENIYQNIEVVLEKLKELSLENSSLKQENADLRKLIGEMMIEMIDDLSV